MDCYQMDPPELSDHGKNWTNYGSWVLEAIDEEGLTGILLGSETRPTHPNQLEGRGPGWAPQSDEERDELAAWRTAESTWHQRNSMVDLLITFGIPDIILPSLIPLDTPLERFSYLERRYGEIPKPVSWQCTNVHDGLLTETVPSQHKCNHSEVTSMSILANTAAVEQPAVVLDECTEITYGPTAPEAAIIDVQNQVAGSCADSSNKYKGNYSGTVTNEQVAAEEESFLDSQSDCTETKTGYLTLETEVADAQQVDNNLPEVEAVAIDVIWPNECTNAPEAPDKSSQCIQDDADATSRDLLDTTSKRAETKTGHTKPKTDIVDVQQVVDILSTVEDGIANQEWLDEHSNTLEAPDERSQRTADEVAERRNPPKWSCEALEPTAGTTKQASKQSIDNGSQTPVERNEHVQDKLPGQIHSDGKNSNGHPEPNAPVEDTSELADDCQVDKIRGTDATMLNILINDSSMPDNCSRRIVDEAVTRDDSPGLKCEPDQPAHVRMHRPVAILAISSYPAQIDIPTIENVPRTSIKMTVPGAEHPGSEPDWSSQLRETECPQPNHDRAHRRHSTPDTPPDKVWGVGRSATAQRKHAQYAPYAQLHISKATFYRHVNEADTEEERARLRSKAREGLDPGKRSGAQSRRAAILQAMAKRRLETVDDAQQHVRRRKHTRSPDIDIPTHEPDLPETDHGPLDDEEVPPTPDLSGPVNEDAFPFIQDRSDAEIDTQLNENFSPHVHDAPDAEIDTQLNEVKLFSARPRCTRCSPTSSR
ncbi:hypothetical protein EDC04DRAFT_3092567 [Pisolithus marmoratus]|nr:hypothetical protein EDC04DRAFT_3092567 [Pisolithus marmoratus]